MHKVWILLSVEKRFFVDILIKISQRLKKRCLFRKINAIIVVDNS